MHLLCIQGVHVSMASQLEALSKFYVEAPIQNCHLFFGNSSQSLLAQAP